MTTFTIDSENNITAFGTPEEPAATTTPPFDTFASQKELAELAAGTHLSVFWRQFVGLHVGLLGLPDKSQPCGINKLGAKCRVCRVFIGGERPGAFGGRKLGSTKCVKTSASESSVWTPVGLHRQTWGTSAVCKSLRNFGRAAEI